MPVWGRCQNPDPGFHQYSAGLLQLIVLWHSRWCDEPPAVSSERRGTSHHWSQAVRAHHDSPTSAALSASLQTSGFQDIHHIYRSLAGTAPVFLADECTLVTAAGRRPLRSADNRTCSVKRSCNQFSGRCSNTVEQSAWTASATGRHLRTIQTIAENVYWLAGR